MSVGPVDAEHHVAVCSCGYESEQYADPRDALRDGKGHIYSQPETATCGFTLEVRT